MLELDTFLLGVMLFAFVAELARRLAPPHREKVALSLKILTAFSRPWLAWSIINIANRYLYKPINNVATFPFFANPWRPDDFWFTIVTELVTSPVFWFWTAVTWSLSAVTIVLTRRILFFSERSKPGFFLVALLILGALLPLAFSCLPYGATDPLNNRGSLLTPWFKTGGTMLYAMPRVKSTDHFLRNFEAIQPSLKLSIHGASHPPAATLSLYWLGRLAGAQEHVAADKLRYAIALTCFNALAIFAMYLLGRDLFHDKKTGLLAALLWTVKPAALAHNTFAQDGVYSVFFILGLWLTLKTTISPKTGLPTLTALGVVFYALTMLTYSWCILTASFGLFLGIHSWLERRTSRDFLIRFITPLLIMTALLVATCAFYGFNYFTIYFESAAFVNRWYKFSTTFQWILALVGGQVEWLLMMGSVISYVFLVFVFPNWLKTWRVPQAQFGLILMALYLVPLLFGPNPLKMETARCWSWMTAIPLVAVAHQLLLSEKYATLWITMAVALNLFQYYIMRLAVCYLS